MIVWHSEHSRLNSSFPTSLDEAMLAETWKKATINRSGSAYVCYVAIPIFPCQCKKNLKILKAIAVTDKDGRSANTLNSAIRKSC